MSLLTQRYSEHIVGKISCFDRVVITGTLPDVCHSRAITSFLYDKRVRIFDFAKWAEPFRDQIRDNAERVAKEAGLEIEYIRKKNFRKEEKIKSILAERGDHAGLVHIFSALEPCSSFRPWHDKHTGKTFLKGDSGKCLHYYFYFVDEDLGLCYLRVPTWAPFRLQFYFNGHEMLARELKKRSMGFTLVENAFHTIDGFSQAQRLADGISPKKLHRILDQVARRYCPILGHFPSGVHWSLIQVEYATDIIFRSREELQALYEVLSRTAIHTVKPEDVATFLGRKLHPLYQGEVGNGFSTRIEGTRIKHVMGRVCVKMYDKHGFILRIETTANDVTFFKHYRKVEHRNGSSQMKFAPMKKSIYSLRPLREAMAAANDRYLRFLSDLDDPTGGIKRLDKISRPVRRNDRSYRGFNLFSYEDLRLFETIARGEFTISGFQNRHLRSLIPGKNTGQVSRMLKRLRLHGLIKKVGRTYKYYLTRLGQTLALTALKLRELIVIPALAEGALMRA